MLEKFEKKLVEVLLVEDYVDYADMVIGWLKEDEFFDYHVVHVSLIVDAKFELTNKQYDIVILDVHLPNGSGTDLVKEVRLLAPWEKTAVLVITGVADDDKEIEVRRALADDYLEKSDKKFPLIKAVQNLGIRTVSRREMETKIGKRMDRLEEKIGDTIKTCETTEVLPPYNLGDKP